MLSKTFSNLQKDKGIKIQSINHDVYSIHIYIINNISVIAITNYIYPKYIIYDVLKKIMNDITLFGTPDYIKLKESKILLKESKILLEKMDKILMKHLNKFKPQ